MTVKTLLRHLWIAFFDVVRQRTTFADSTVTNRGAETVQSETVFLPPHVSVGLCDLVVMR